MQKYNAFLLCYEEVKLLQINIQNFGERGADSGIKRSDRIFNIVEAEVAEQLKYNTL